MDGPCGRKGGQALAYPTRGAARRAKLMAAASGPRVIRTAGPTGRNVCSSSRQDAKITRNRFEEVSTISEEAHSGN